MGVRIVYFQDAEDDIKKLVPEGIEGRVPFGGTLHEVVYQMLGGTTLCYGVLWLCNRRGLVRGVRSLLE